MIQLWRDGEFVACYTFTDVKVVDGTIYLTIPKGTYIELVTDDELRIAWMPKKPDEKM